MRFSIIAIISMLVTISSNALANNYLKDVENFGLISGEGLACGVKYYPQYEHIARAYLVSAAKSDEEQAAGMYKYNEAKVRAFMKKKQVALMGCDEVKYRFNKQKILKTKIYKNGKIKFPDGKVIIPRREYDANLVYDRKIDEKAKLDAMYNKILKKKKVNAQKQGIYQKIKQYESRVRRN